MDSSNNYLSLFSAIGIEIEYMIVHQNTLDIMPIADKILENFGGKIINEVELGEIAISNELVKHVLELKTNGPKNFSYDLHTHFHETIIKINDFLRNHEAMLLSTGMHPWFDPEKGVELWPHGDRKIYACYNQIFNCKGHGWSNLQSIHINLPFANDLEFKKLHNAIRIVLPLIPSLTASSPFLEGKKSNYLDTRLDFYRKNQEKIPLITGHVIPEFVSNKQNYHDLILNPLYQAISPYDPEGILQDEWLNSRGAIARFDRMAIEIRVVDTQECPLADITYAYFIEKLLKYLIENTDNYLVDPVDTLQLKKVFIDCVSHGSNTIIENKKMLEQFNLDLPGKIQAKEFWLATAEKLNGSLPIPIYNNFIKLTTAGTLAERILRATGNNPTSHALLSIYQQLANCLATNELFI